MQLEQGIEILNQTEIIEHNATAALITGLVSMIIVIVIFSIIYSVSNIQCFIPIGVLLGFLTFAFVVLGVDKSISTGKYQYQVTVDDSVSFNDFTEKYCIIKQEGKIYTIELKEDIEDIE